MYQALRAWAPAVVVVLAFGAPLVFIALEKSESPKYAVTDESLHLFDATYGRVIPRTRLVISQAHAIQLSTSGLWPWTRTEGVRANGYCAGWYKGANGERVYVLTSDCRAESLAAYIPTRDNFALVIGAAKPEQLIAELAR